MRSHRSLVVLAVILALAAAIGLAGRGSAAQHVVHRARAVADAGVVATQPVAVAAPPSLGLEERARAEGLYERLCAGCHGIAGEGEGALAQYLGASPRDFVHQPFKWRSTASGTPPTVDDVARTIARGVPGAMMPAFGGSLASADRTLLARYVLAFANATHGTPIVAAPAPNNDATTLARGEAIYARLQCAMCHGPALHGDGPSAATLHPPPYDLTRHAPRGGADAASILRSFRTGLDGTAMPAFDGVLPLDDLAALAAWVASRIPSEVAAQRAPNDPGEARWLDAQPANATAPVSSGLLDATRAARENTFWRFPLALQGEGPPQLTPAERSLAPDRCARCHAQQFADFRTTVHAAAMGPGVLGQLVDMSPREAIQCQTCHGPLAEQSPDLLRDASAAPSTSMHASSSSAPGNDTRANPDFDIALRPQGIVCAACHLRGRERFGPPVRASSNRLAAVNYPLTTLSRYERGDFCAPCHQHTPSESVAGVPILDTVNEWIRSPYFARGVQCQHCHMPDRAHTWRGAHDPDTVRQAVHVYGRAFRDHGEAMARISIENVGAGHAFPGTATPAAVMLLEWVDADGHRLGEAQRDVIQRHLTWNGQSFVQEFDTRILPGAARTLEARTNDARAVALRFTLTFRPDDYYEGFYRAALSESRRSAEGRAMLEQALAHAMASPYVVHTGILPVESPR